MILIAEMGILNDDAVLIEPGKHSGDPSVVTVNCPDESGLGSTLCRIILEFGLSITRAGKNIISVDSNLTLLFFHFPRYGEEEYTLFCRLPYSRIFQIQFC